LFLGFDTQFGHSFGHSFSVYWSWRHSLFDRHLASLLVWLPRWFMPKGLLTFGRVSPTMRGAQEAIDKNK
jgi:hypothetical protein